MFYSYAVTNDPDPVIMSLYAGTDLREAMTTAKANEGDQFSKILVKEMGVGCLYRWVHAKFQASPGC